MSSAETQTDVFGFLADPASHGGTSVKRIDTHAAVVFLAGERVLKVKRAVTFPFLDFSTLEKRQAACEAEVAVNKNSAPDIYRGVVAIKRAADGRLSIGGDGATLEWAVEMRRFDEAQTLDKLADRGRIDAALADELGRVVAAAHARAQPVPPASWIEAVGAYIDEHEAAFRALPALFPAEETAALAATGRAAYARIRPLLIERGQRGLIRRIHGDLHLGNIVLIEGRPVLFDAIEFSEIIASGDVLYDLAFLVMDLVERGLRENASIVLNRYLAATRREQDLDALGALPFYLSMRGAIRAKVTAARLDQADAGERPEIARIARQYFDWALRFLAPVAPVLIAVGGLSGTGKTQLARKLAQDHRPEPGAVVLRSDVERKAIFGDDEFTALPAAAYTPVATLRVYAAIIDKARRVLAAGHSAIADAVFASPQERAGIEQSAKALGIPFRGIFLTADLATRVARVGARSGDASDANASVVQAQEHYDLHTLDWTRVDASGTPDEVLALARRAIGSR